MAKPTTRNEHLQCRRPFSLLVLACSLKLSPAVRVGVGGVFNVEDVLSNGTLGGSNANSSSDLGESVDDDAASVARSRNGSLAETVEVDAARTNRTVGVPEERRLSATRSASLTVLSGIRASNSTSMLEVARTNESSGNLAEQNNAANQSARQYHVPHFAASGSQYGVNSWKLILDYLEQSVPWGNGPRSQKIAFFLTCMVLILGPPILYKLSFGALRVLLRELYENSNTATAIVDALSLPLKILSVVLCLNLVCELVIDSLAEEYRLLKDLHWMLHALLTVVCCVALIRVLSALDGTIQQMALDRVSNPAYLKRKEFMHELAHGSSYVGGTGVEHEHGYFLFRYVWRPFYIVTVAVTVLFCLCAVSVAPADGLVLAVGYFFVMALMSVFGARTAGPEIYGSVMLFLERPFEEGDIITLDKMNSAGGMKTDIMSAVVTGFVERIGLRSTIVRRFDMRSVYVPNSYFMQYAVANWKRPRKLIYFTFKLSHRSPPEVAKAFQEKVKYILGNHEGVDQKQYIKAVFQKLDFGLEFVVICFNAPGSSKQKVQQDIILRIVDLARRMDVHMTFNQQSLYVERQDIPETEYYAGETQPTRGQLHLRNSSFEFGETLPKEKNMKAKSARFAPKGQMVVRLEKVTLNRIAAPAATEEAGAADCGAAQSQQPFADEDGTQPTYRVALRVTQASEELTQQMESDPSAAVQLAMAARKQAKAIFSQTRLAMLGEPTDTGARAASFFENVAVDLKNSRNGAGAQRLVELHVLRVEKKWILGWRNETAGVAYADAEALAKENNQDPKQVALWSPTGQQVGSVAVQVFLPEPSKAKGDGEPKLEEKKGSPKSPKGPRAGDPRAGESMRRAVKEVDSMIRASKSMKETSRRRAQLASAVTRAPSAPSPQNPHLDDPAGRNQDDDSDMGAISEDGGDENFEAQDSNPDPEKGSYGADRVAKIIQQRKTICARNSPVLKAAEPARQAPESTEARRGMHEHEKEDNKADEEWD